MQIESASSLPLISVTLSGPSVEAWRSPSYLAVALQPLPGSIEHCFLITPCQRQPCSAALRQFHVHAETRAVMQPLDIEVVDTARINCHQCGVMSYPHRICRCVICGLRHANDPGCRPSLCDQCGLTSAPHNACRCRHCSKIHTKRSGCRNLPTRILRHMPAVQQRAVLNSRQNCHQCGQFTFAHSSCRCRTCGRFHSVAAECRPSDGVVAAALSVCPQCQVESYSHRPCMSRSDWAQRISAAGRNCNWQSRCARA